MKRCIYAFLAVAGVALAQAPVSAPQPAAAANIPPETVVAVVDGRKMTAAEVEQFVKALPPQLQQNFARDKKEFLRQYAVLKHLAAIAEKEKLGEATPYKERLDYARTQILVQSKVDQVSRDLPVMPEDQKKFYDENRDRFTSAKIRVIYIPFSSAAPAAGDSKTPKPLTEAEAQAKAAGIVKEIRAGADFVKLVKEHSKDAQSAAKDGEFGTVRKSDTLPQAIKDAIFALKTGEVSEPVRQPNGFYIFKVDETVVEPYEKVKDNIFNDLKQQKFNAWFENLRKQVEVKIENEAFFASPAPGPTPPPAQAPAPAKTPPAK
jgi:parvulin-like peptidyl-prolyl isomerase